MTISGAEPYPGGLSPRRQAGDRRQSRSSAAWSIISPCGTGSYLNQFSKIVPIFHFNMLLGRDDAAAFKEVVKHARVTMEARVKTPENAEKVLSEGKCDLVSIVRGQIADPASRQQGEGRPGRGHPAVHLLQSAVPRPAHARLLRILPRQSVGLARARVGRRLDRRRRKSRATCWWSAADRPGWRRRGSPPSAATACAWSRRPASLAGSSGSPPASRSGARSAAAELVPGAAAGSCR